METENDKIKEAVIFSRVSSVNYRQNTERQVADLTKYAEIANLKIVKIFEERISGGKKNAERKVLLEMMDYIKSNDIKQVLVSELSRLGRNAFEVLTVAKDFIDAGINVYFQKEQFSLLDDTGKPGIVAPIMLAVLSTCAQLERENIQFRLNSGRQQYIEKGGKLGRKTGSKKTEEQMKEQYAEVIRLLKKGYGIRQIARLESLSVATVQKVKNMFVTPKKEELQETSKQ